MNKIKKGLLDAIAFAIVDNSKGRLYTIHVNGAEDLTAVTRERDALRVALIMIAKGGICMTNAWYKAIARQALAELKSGQLHKPE